MLQTEISLFPFLPQRGLLQTEMTSGCLKRGKLGQLSVSQGWGRQQGCEMGVWCDVWENGVGHKAQQGRCSGGQQGWAQLLPAAGTGGAGTGVWCIPGILLLGG